MPKTVVYKQATDSRAELALLLERAEIAQEAGGIGIHDYDIVNDVIDWDARARALWGVSDDEPISYATFANGVHPDDLPQVEAAVAASQDPDGDGRYHAQYRVISRCGIERTVEATGRTVFAGRTPVRLIGTVRDISAEVAARRELEEARHFAQTLIDSGPTLFYIFDLVGRRNIFVGAQAISMTRFDHNEYSRLGTDVLAEMMHPDDLSRIEAHHYAIRHGLIAPPFEIEYRLRDADGKWLWMYSKEVVYRHDDDGKPTQILGTATDITRRHEERELRNLLIRELDHRVKNAQTVIYSVAMMTLRPQCDAEIWRQFEKRVAALSSGQRLLTDQHWQSADLRMVAEQVFKPFMSTDGSNIRLTGPPTQVDGAQVGTIALTLHELATNAVKYGALSTMNGHVEVSWSNEGERPVLEWQEYGGPVVAEPDRLGFGASLIGSLARDLKTDGIRYRPDGLYCHLTL